MACPQALALPAEFAQAHAPEPTTNARHRPRCARRVAARPASPTRGLVAVMGIATTLALVLALLQLADGQSGNQAANTLFVAAGFNLLFAALYAPLLALFTLRRGVFKAVGAFFVAIGAGVAYTLCLLFASVVVFVALASVLF